MLTSNRKDLLNSLAGQHILSSKTFTKDTLTLILETTEKMEKGLKDKTLPKFLKDHILATLFFEPSTRTRLSFESAMIRLGGQVVSLEQGGSSSIVKGETLTDTGQVVSQYADVIVVRHPERGSAEKIACKSCVPVINAGDGPNEHPTQALLDLYTIFSETGTLEGLNIGFLGDLKFGRTVHSLLNLLGHYNISFTMISHPDISLPTEIINELKSKNKTITVEEDLEKAIKTIDVLYVTRIQEERFKSSSEFNRVKDHYRLTQSVINTSKPKLVILHPLPRINEIAPEVDCDPKARYFKQAENGLYLRMALLALILGKIE